MNCLQDVTTPQNKQLKECLNTDVQRSTEIPCFKVKFIMCGIQLKKNMRHKKKQENMTHNKDKNQSIQTDPEMANVKEQVDKDIKTVIMYMFYVQVSRGKT